MGSNSNNTPGGYLIPTVFLASLLGRFKVVPGEGWLWDRWRVYADDNAGGYIIARFTRLQAAERVAERLNFFLYRNRNKIQAWLSEEAIAKLIEKTRDSNANTK